MLASSLGPAWLICDADRFGLGFQQKLLWQYCHPLAPRKHCQPSWQSFCCVMAERPAVKILFFTTSCPSTLKVRGDIERITQILNAKRIQYEEIDLNMYPERRRELLLFKDGVTSLPQLRVNGVYVGDGETVQELEDFGELDEVLEGGEVPSTSNG